MADNVQDGEEGAAGPRAPDAIHTLLEDISENRNMILEGVDAFIYEAGVLLGYAVGEETHNREQELLRDMQAYMEPLIAENELHVENQMAERERELAAQAAQILEERRTGAIRKLGIMSEILTNPVNANLDVDEIHMLLDESGAGVEQMLPEIEELIQEREDPEAVRRRVAEMEAAVEGEIETERVAREHENEVTLRLDRERERADGRAALLELREGRQIIYDDFLADFTLELYTLIGFFLRSLQLGGQRVNPTVDNGLRLVATNEGRQQLFDEFQNHLQFVALNQGLVDRDIEFERSHWRQIAVDRYLQSGSVLGIHLMLPDLRDHVAAIRRLPHYRREVGEPPIQILGDLNRSADSDNPDLADELLDDFNEEVGGPDGADPRRQGHLAQFRRVSDDQLARYDPAYLNHPRIQPLYTEDGQINMAVPAHERFWRHFAADLREVGAQYNFAEVDMDQIKERLEHPDLAQRRLALFAAAFFGDGPHPNSLYYEEWIEDLMDPLEEIDDGEEPINEEGEAFGMWCPAEPLPGQPLTQALQPRVRRDHGRVGGRRVRRMPQQLTPHRPRPGEPALPDDADEEDDEPPQEGERDEGRAFVPRERRDHGRVGGRRVRRMPQQLTPHRPRPGEPALPDDADEEDDEPPQEGERDEGRAFVPRARRDDGTVGGRRVRRMPAQATPLRVPWANAVGGSPQHSPAGARPNADGPHQSPVALRRQLEFQDEAAGSPAVQRVVEVLERVVDNIRNSMTE